MIVPFSEEDSIELNIKICKELIEQNELDEAYIILKKQLAIDPTVGEVYYLIALIYDKKRTRKRQRSSLLYYSKAISKIENIRY